MPLPDPQPAYFPRLPTTFVADSEAFLVDPFSLEVEVRDDAGVVAFARTAVLLTAYPSGDRLGLGYYRARNYNPQSDLISTAGRRTITWYAVLESGDAEISWTTTTERLAAAKPDLGVPYYALIQDLRDEGFTTAALTDARAHQLLARATRYIEMFTGRRFVAEPRRMAVDGKGGPLLQLGEPICAIDPEGVRVLLEPFPLDATALPFARDSIRVYARHLTDRLVHPDDRENPKLEVFSAFDLPREANTLSRTVWPRGSQNVIVDGVFGYTEPDGSPTGRTPELVRLAAMLLVRRELAGIGSATRGDVAAAARVTAERTRDQSVSYASPTSGGGRPGNPLLGAITGDPELDTLLVSFRRQHAFAAV